MKTEWAIELYDLQKSYGATKALDGVNLRIKKGTVFGLLGPNGAGKTTTIRALATLAKPTAGRATILGYDVVKDAAKVRSLIGLTGQYASVDEDLTGLENLTMVGQLLGLSKKDARARAAELLHAFGIADAGRRQAKTYSGGMRRRLDIAASLVMTPEILFLDEPTTGLDPRSRNQVWEVVRAIAATGTTVVLTTQYLEEADVLADRLAVIDQGRIIAEGTSHELKASVGSSRLHVRVRDAKHRSTAHKILVNRLGAGIDVGPDPVLLHGPASEEKVGTAMNDLRRAGIPVAEYSLGAPSLDAVFFALTGKATEAA